MPTHTVETPDVCSSEVTELFDHAFRVYGDSLKVAMKAQEEAVRLWGEAIGKIKPLQTVTADLIPIAQKNADEYLRLLETSYRRNADLLKKVIHTQNGHERADVEKNTREFWEASVEVARENAQDLASTNLRVAQSWTEAFKREAQAKAAAGK